MRQSGEEKPLQLAEKIKDLYQVFTDKSLFAEWLLSINIIIGRKLTRWISRIEADYYIETHSDIDLRTAPAAVKRNRLYDEDVLKLRWDLCAGCEHLTEDLRCLKCGCPMMAKHKLAHAKCPIGKWDRYAS